MGDVSMGSNDFDRAIVWIEIDGPGNCAGGELTNFSWTDITAEANALSISSSAAVGAGTHTVEFCGGSFAGETEFGAGSLSAQWVENAQGAAMSSAGVGLSFNELIQQTNMGAFGN